MTQEALRMALKALEENHHLIEEHERPEYLVHYDQIISLLAKALAKEKALQALHSENERLGLYKDAYAQPEQEPVAWMRQDGQKVTTASDRHNYPDYETRYSIPLYTTPPQRTWQGLTDQDWKEIEDMPDTFDQGVAWAQAKLKEKNT